MIFTNLQKNQLALISIITPTWNRSTYLEKVWEGLMGQTYRNIEWVVGNDGSNDNTIDIIRKLALKSYFPITLINASCRIGKSRIDNEAVRAAQGDFIIWCDSDDYLFPNTLEILLNTWYSIPLNQRSDFCGVSALCETVDGILGNKFYQTKNPIDLKWNDLFQKLGSDLVIFTRSDLVKANPFLEVDFLIPESSVWNAIGTKKTRFLPLALKMVRYGEANCITKSGLMAYNRGNAHAFALARCMSTVKPNWIARLRQLINYLRYCIHGDIGFNQALKMWDASLFDFLKFIFLLPVAIFLSLKDEFQGKVKKTHREFIKAQRTASIELIKFNQQ